MTKIRRYSELREIDSYEGRYEYLKLGGTVGHTTMGFDRWIAQHFYHSREWKTARRDTIARDRGCDLGIPDYDIHEMPLVHHINPIAVSDIVEGSFWIFDPEFLITTTKMTHNAIHYGDSSLLRQPLVERRSGDTKLW